MSEWFQGKVQGLLSVGATVWKVVTGELGFAEIAKMAWGAIVAMIPPTLIRILIEKLVAMIVPAAGALMVIIEGIQAAWGTVSRIIQALETFIAFLKAVKGGGAGPKFAAALAQAAIVVLDFVANFLLLKLGKGLKALAGNLKGIARRLMKKRRGMKAKKRRGSSKKTKNNKKPKGKKKSKDEKERLSKPEQVPLPDGTFGQSSPFSMDGESHTVLSKESGGGKIIVRSAPTDVMVFLQRASQKASTPEEKQKVNNARGLARRARKAANALAARRKERVSRKKGNRINPRWKRKQKVIAKKDAELESLLSSLRNALSQISHRVHLNVRRFKWGGKSRPSFSQETKQALARRFPDAHISGTTNLLTNAAGRPVFNRRHIVAFSTTKDLFQTSLDGKTFKAAGNFLRGRGAQGKLDTNPLVESAAKAALVREFNNPKNLFVASAKENQDEGRKLGRAKGDKKRAEKELSGAKTKAEMAAAQRKVDSANERIEKSATDTPKPKQRQQGVEKKKIGLGPGGRRAVNEVDTVARLISSLRTGAVKASALEARLSRAASVLLRQAQVVSVKSDARDVRDALVATSTLRQRIASIRARDAKTLSLQGSDGI